ncbi:hypothetical protein P5673_028983 [Acropora cervicornis]|uniref:Uncharacterized protein n=1 Tax=Acropora cervicornis TaxID=6130 RepID=A0AAD9UUC2_ACRCE|nr:hypothetical protein P5673_028983 [Acropora cervicornis]
MLPFFLTSSKTDQFRNGAWIVIARPDLPTCPVKTLRVYNSAAQINAQIDLSEDLPLFRALATPRSKEKVRSQGISYTRVRELVKDAFRGLRDVSKIGVHNLGYGGATSAANAGIPDRLLKGHGHWASGNAKDGCVKDDFNSRLKVNTKQLFKISETLFQKHCKYL